jgi:hypothetical protein
LGAGIGVEDHPTQVGDPFSATRPDGVLDRIDDQLVFIEVAERQPRIIRA